MKVVNDLLKLVKLWLKYYFIQNLNNKNNSLFFKLLI